MNRSIQLLLFAAALLLSGCASVSSTAVFYQPTSATIYPPKGSKAIIPILSAPPSRPFTEIGSFNFQTDLSYAFVQNALLYNARRAGADAIIIKNYKNWTLPYWYTVPPSVNWIPVGGGYYRGGCGGWYGGTAFVPVTYPGYSGVNYRNFTGIEARMIVFKN
jgi:hypothetical protein